MTTKMAHWDGEGIWAAVFGPYATRDEMLRACADTGVSIHEQLRAAIREAVEQGADFDSAEAYRGLCAQLGISPETH